MKIIKTYIIIFFLQFFAALHVYCAVEQVSIYVPAFKGKGSLGLSVSTILNFQIWQTLRKAPWPNPNGLSFGSGLVIWSRHPLEELTHKYADDYAKDMYRNPQFVYWGKVREYGGGTIVNSFLTISYYKNYYKSHNYIWSILIDYNNSSYSFAVNFPQTRYEFEPIILNNEVVKRYSNPEGIILYKNKNKDAKIGYLGPSFRAFQHDSNWVKVRSNESNLIGWIELPKLSENRNEIVDFIGGLVRIKRKDWNGAIKLLRNVDEIYNTPTSIRIDSFLLRALSKERMHKSGISEIRKAYNLDPLAYRTIKYYIMIKLNELNKNIKKKDYERTEQVAKSVLKFIGENDFIFSENDQWILKVRGFLNEIVAD